MMLASRPAPERVHPEGDVVVGEVLVELPLGDAGLDDGVAELGVDLEDAVHAAEVEDDLVVAHGAGVAIAPVLAAGDRVDADAGLGGDPHHGLDLGGGVGVADGEGSGGVGAGGAGVSVAGGVVGLDVVGAEDVAPGGEGLIGADGRRRGRGGGCGGAGGCGAWGLEERFGHKKPDAPANSCRRPTNGGTTATGAHGASRVGRGEHL